MSISECRASCKKARLEAGIKLADDRITTFLTSLSESTYHRLRSSHGISFPLAFPSPTSEINFLCILSLLNAFSGYRALFHAKTGDGVYQNVVRLLIGLHLADEDALSAKGLAKLNPSTVAGIWNVDLTREIPHGSIPGLSIMERGGEMSEVVDLVVEACKQTGEILLKLGYDSMGGWVIGVLKETEELVAGGKDLDAADLFISKITSTFPAFRDTSPPTPTLPTGIPIHKRVHFLLYTLHQRLSTKPDADLRVPDPKILPMFVDNVLPTMSVHLGLLDLTECTIPSLRQWGESSSNASSSPTAQTDGPKTHNSNGEIIPGPELSARESYIVRAATLDLGSEVVRRARELAVEREDLVWLREMTEVDLDGYLWSVAKDDPVFRKVPRMLEKRTLAY